MKSTKSLVFSLFTMLLFATSACTQNWSAQSITGDGPKVTKTLAIDDFTGLTLAISANVNIKQGSPQSVKVEAQQNIIDNLKKEVKDGVWKIGFDKNVRNHDEMTIWVTVPSIKELGVSGSGSILGEGKFSNLADLSLAISGAGDIKFEADSKNLEVGISGSGNMDLAGTTGNSNLRISGSGDINAFDLRSQSCNIRISGSGDSSVNVGESLDVAIAGSGDVFYKGRPSVKSKVSGSGSVESK